MKIIEKLVETIEKITRKKLPNDSEALPTLSLTNDLGIDSLDFINFLFRVEQIFDIKIPEQDIDDLDLAVLGKLADYIADKSKI